MGRIIPYMKWKIKFMFQTTNQIRIEHGPFIVDLPMKKGDLP
jgi:hypothetical protein